MHKAYVIYVSVTYYIRHQCVQLLWNRSRILVYMYMVYVTKSDLVTAYM